ncbi:flagellar basal body rod protein FlgC [Sneathiella glossodoripedis]|uniref:flagellar basal body rod protein FlgC n=1 Tax=Sneathiella glossodoripedis TaxID=418853 RepID=UPI00046ED510|nr:flagellar basal body rod C-terminal domain-containing protein [Sneathiella glossodoripedis]
MSSIIGNALAGMNAATRRIDAGASNIANVNTVGKVGGSGSEAAYTPVDAVQVSGPAGGPEVHIKPRDPATSLSYQPSHPHASNDGLVESPNVDLATELVNNKIAQHTYEANIKSIITWDEMQATLLDIKS